MIRTGRYLGISRRGAVSYSSCARRRARSVASRAGSAARSFGRFVARLLASTRSSGRGSAVRHRQSPARWRRRVPCRRLRGREPSTRHRCAPDPARQKPVAAPPNPGIQNPPASAAARPSLASSMCSGQMSISWVLTGAPSSAAAPSPTTRKRTPRSVSARKSARSAGVSAKSSTLQPSRQRFGLVNSRHRNAW